MNQTPTISSKARSFSKKKSMSQKSLANQTILRQLGEELKNIFNQSQLSLHGSKKNSKAFMKIYRLWYSEDKIDDFMKIFINIVKSVLICNKSSPFTKRTLEFLTLVLKEISVFEENKENERLQNVAAKEASGQLPVESSDSDDELSSLLDPDQTIINSRYLSPPSIIDAFIRDHLLKFMKCENENIRFNTATLLKKILDTQEEIEEETYARIIQQLSQSSFDKSKQVRVAVIICFRKLQMVIESDNEAFQILKYHLTFDPDSFVRACVLKVIEVHSNTIMEILLATRDENSTVRRAAYLKIAENCGINNFAYNDRLRLLKNGLFDTDQSLREIVLKKMIPNWIAHLDNNLVSFLGYLDIKFCLDFSITLLDDYFASLQNNIIRFDITSLHQLVFEFKEQYLDEYKLLTRTNLTEENSFLWSRLCLYCNDKNLTYYKKNDENKNKTLEQQLEENDQEENRPNEPILMDLLDEILPDVPTFCDFVDGFVRKILNHSDQLIEERNFVFKQLLNIAGIYQIKDIAQWNRMMETFKPIILNDDSDLLFTDYIEPIFVVFDKYFREDHEAFLSFTMDLINSINNPKIHMNDESEIDPSSQLTLQNRMESVSFFFLFPMRNILVFYFYFLI
ncbi:DEP domain-containing protein 1A [Sarcoptes scabiei]|nr:DEP domain-containing protein 1A [Sarcoptes scabiei]